MLSTELAQKPLITVWWSEVRCSDLSVAARAAALGNLVRAQAASLADYVETELAREGVDEEWLGHVLFAAEEVRFPDSEQRARVRGHLQRWALSLRDRAETRLFPTLRAAVRRYASLLPAPQAEELLAFLRPQDRAACWQVALQGIQNIFSAAPPVDGPAVQSLRDRVAEIAEELLREGTPTPGEPAALVVTAIHALTVLSDSRLPDIVCRLVRSAPGWLSDLLGKRLDDQARRWREVSEVNGVAARLAIQGNGRLLE